MLAGVWLSEVPSSAALLSARPSPWRSILSTSSAEKALAQAA
jgi:hypothetical protein